MKLSWCVTLDLRDGEPAPLLIKVENNKEMAALKQFVERFGQSVPKECLYRPHPYDDIEENL
jgi:hypothetical protein